MFVGVVCIGVLVCMIDWYLTVLCVSLCACVACVACGVCVGC